MPLDLVGYEKRVSEAVQFFWKSRLNARRRQLAAGDLDHGERASVTAGKNMDGFVILLHEIVRANGLDQAQIHRQRAVLTLPGYFRPTKIWDFLVIYKEELIAAIELKSHVGPSFGNNFNNRAEEAIGTAVDFWTVYREGGLGKQPRPFVGWLILVEDAPGSRRSINATSPHFPILEEFADTSYLKRYDLLCQKLVQEQLYSTAAMLAAPQSALDSGNYVEFSPMTGLKTFVTALAGHIAATVARIDRE